MARGHVNALDMRHTAEQGRPSCVTGRKQACRAMILSAPDANNSRSQIAWRRLISAGSGATAAGSNGSGAWSEKAVTRVFPLAFGSTSTVTIGNSARESLVVHTGGRHCATFFFPRAVFPRAVYALCRRRRSRLELMPA
jgi:hypothetical protein